MAERDLIELETAGWKALSCDGETAARHFDGLLDETVVMLLPGGMVLDDRRAVVESMSGRPWASFRLDSPQVLCPTDDTAVVAYGVVAHREGSPEYSALVSSMYVRREHGWRMAFHQQTPR